MPDNHERGRPLERKLILIVDDEIINREILGALLSEDYDVIYAADGQEAISLIQRHSDTLSLVLLDLMMPVMSGMVVLKRLSDQPELSRIPVIVMTADQEAEVACLELGALDFVPKPYPRRNIVLARMRRTIELSEDRQIIRSTERDPLTGLYNREYFYSYAQNYDQHHKGTATDAIIVDINHFHMLNERHGRACADRVLKHIGEKLRETVASSGGIVCRREADTFMIYCPHRTDYKQMLDYAAGGLEAEDSSMSHIRLRMGVYPNVDRSMELEQRFDRAKTAADAVRSNYTQNISIYDKKLHESEMFAEQLIEEFDRAIRERQFKVYYQPKFDIRPEKPTLASAEALIRWQHPALGMISPGTFIPLFEANGMIQKLDNYVWAEAAAQVRAWKEQYGVGVPVSGNVSRVDMFDPGLVSTFERLLKENRLAPEELLLEITESAYTDDAEFIINTVNALRDIGLKVEMDDFGTGYSSLGMISHLPIDALKLDMMFVRNAFDGQGDVRMLELIIDIADYLGVPVIAEGVENREQVNALKTMGCDIVQGFYFSRPVPAEAFAAFVVEKKQALESAAFEAPAQTADKSLMSIAAAVSGKYDTIYCVDSVTEAYTVLNGQNAIEGAGIHGQGIDFFETFRRELMKKVVNDDRERVFEALERENVMEALNDGASYRLDCRLKIENNLFACRLEGFYPSDGDTRHFLVGVRSARIDARRMQADAARDDSLTFARIAQALATDYFSIYCVDTETDRFLEFTAHDAYEDLGIEKEGGDFFNLSRKNVLRVVYPEDQNDFLQAFTKENVLKAIRENGSFTITYRLMIHGAPNYVSLKASALKDGDGRHIVVGVNNIHAGMQRKMETITYAGIAEALAADYFSIYYVDTTTDKFIEYSSHEEYESLSIEKGGDDFFTASRANVPRVMHPDDQKEFLEVFTKENLMRELEAKGSFTISYRLMFNDVPTWASMKVTRMLDKSDPHIVIGVNNIDTQMLRKEAYEKTRQQSLTFARIAQALSKDYYSIYLVNTENDEFVEYSASAEHQALRVEQSGTNFFEECRRNVIRLVHPDDLKKALMIWEKDRLMNEIQDGGPFSITYRLMFDENPVYINCKVIRLTDDEIERYIIIGISNVDAQIKREQEYVDDLKRAKDAAMMDTLTGVKSRRAFVDAEKDINANIDLCRQGAFAVAVCDVNGLKAINDTPGHKAGDDYIRNACSIICDQFKHSPVFRVSGDKFVVILQGRDYEAREEVMARFDALSRANRETGGVAIACGLSEWNVATDERFEDVLERADANMYENRRQLKI